MNPGSPFSLEGRRAIVTGGGRGLGAGMATALATAGAKIALVARNESQLADAAAAIGPHAAAIPFDLGGATPVSELVDLAESSLGGAIDVVVHAAGVQHRESAEFFSREEWQRVLDVNLTAPFLLSQEIGRRQLADARDGSHIFVGSLTSQLARPELVAYAASKSGILGVMRTLTIEWSGRGIRANAIGPGYIHTTLTDTLFQDPARRAQLLARIPIGRFGTAEDMGGAVVFLASDASSYISGQLLMIDGGWSAS